MATLAEDSRFDPEGRTPSASYINRVISHFLRLVRWLSLGACIFGRVPSSPTHKPTCIDLFCGAGGFAEGLHQAGFRTVYAADLDEQAICTFRFNHPESIAEQADVSDLTGDRIRQIAKLPKRKLDLLVGGPPCQGFSVAGQRLPEDPKNHLYLEFVRLASELRPRVLIMENVQGIESMSGGTVLRAIHASMKEIGYQPISATLVAADFGVPQIRPRFILLAVEDGEPSLPPPSHSREVSGVPQLFGPPPAPTVQQALEDLPEINQGEGSEELNHPGVYSHPFQYERQGTRAPGTVFNHRATRHSPKIVERYSMIPPGCTNAVVPQHLRTKKVNVYRLLPDRPSRTVTCNFRTDLLHPWCHRGLTVREAARLQSFDDDYRFFGNLTRKAKWVTQDDQVGNAVPPLLARALGEHVLETLL